MKKIGLALTTILAAFSANAAESTPHADVPPTNVHLKITGLRNDAGLVSVAIFDSQDGFPREPKKAIRKILVPAKQGEVDVDVHDLPPGDYAFGFMHDENKNGKIDFNFIGMPKEGFGFSNNPRVSFGPPSFDRSKVHVEAGDKTIVIDSKYF